MNNVDEGTGTPRLHSVETVMDRLSTGRTNVYALMKTGRLRSVKMGGRRLVSESALRQFIADLEGHGDVEGVIA